MIAPKLIFTLSCFLLLFSGVAYGGDKIIIAKDGGSRQLIELSLAQITLAASQGADYIELHVNMSADEELVVFKDVTLNRMTNVATTFPLKARQDHGYYVVDFTLAELRQLRIKNQFENDPNALAFAIPSLKETLALIRQLEKILGHPIGISIQIGEPIFYRDNNKDISSHLLETLVDFDYPETGKIFIQSYNSDELQRLQKMALTQKQVTFPLIQLIRQPEPLMSSTDTPATAEFNEQDWLFTNIGLRLVASYATALALPESALFSLDGTPLLTEYLEESRKYGLKILGHTTTQTDSMPAYADTLQTQLDHFYKQGNIDGIYTDDFLKVQQHNLELADREKQRAELPEFFSNLELTLPKRSTGTSPATGHDKAEPGYTPGPQF